MRYTQGVALGCGLLGPSARCIVDSNLFAYISIFDTPSIVHAISTQPILGHPTFDVTLEIPKEQSK